MLRLQKKLVLPNMAGLQQPPGAGGANPFPGQSGPNPFDVFNQFPQMFGQMNQGAAEAKLHQEALELKNHFVSNPTSLQQILHQNNLQSLKDSSIAS